MTSTPQTITGRAVVQISQAGRALSAEEALQPVRERINSLEAHNAALGETTQHQADEIQRLRVSIKTFSAALNHAGDRERQLSEHLAEIIQAASERNPGAILTLATNALRVLA